MNAVIGRLFFYVSKQSHHIVMHVGLKAEVQGLFLTMDTPVKQSDHRVHLTAVSNEL